MKFILYEFEKELEGYNIQVFIIDEFQKCVVVEDSLILFISIFENPIPICSNVEEMYGWTRNNKYMDFPDRDSKRYELHIEELTYNTLGFKHNHTKFLKELKVITDISYLSVYIQYRKFRGYTRLYWAPERETLIEQVDRMLPLLELRERYEIWDGIRYNFVVMEMEGANGVLDYAVAYTTRKPHSYVLSKGKEWIHKGIYGGDFRQRYQGFIDAFKSWKGTKRQARMENHFKYISIEKSFREKDDAWKHADIILEKAYDGQYDSIEKATYTRPQNKWKSEELVYNTVKKLYKEHTVIYQHRPFFLKSDIGGQMSYDIFISGLNIAIEYQGKQHFEPVDFFGGEDSFKKTRKRDELKKKLSELNGIRLVFINYWETINPELIRERINCTL